MLCILLYPNKCFVELGKINAYPLCWCCCWYILYYDGRKVTTYTTHQWYVVLEVFCVVYVGKPPTQHVVVGLPTCVVGGKPTTTCCCWYTNMLLEVNQQQHVVVGLPTCCWR